VICTDKTGTLTRNEMTVQALWTPQAGTVVVDGVGYEPVGGFTPDLPEAGRSLLEAGVLCNDASLQAESGRWTVTGDPTEGALLTAAEKAGMKASEVRQESPRLDAIPFESENQFMATLHRMGEASVLLLKGAPEVLLSRCSEVAADEVHDQVVGMASRGIRVLAFARKELPRDQVQVDLEDTATGFQFLGLQGMIDPPRSEAIEAIRDCHQAGITVKMITGDHQATAQSIGEQLGLHSEIPVIAGRELNHMDGPALDDALRRCHVFARVAPEHKLRLVKTLQAQGEVVAMTGDGVNDAPALKKADIGVSMGLTGTDVAREASKLVLADDNFATIVAAVREGRVIYDNIRKFLRFLLTSNVSEIMVIVTALMAGWPIPLTALQILWINLVTDGLPALALGIEPAERNVMGRKPRNPQESIFGGGMLRSIVIGGAVMTALVVYVMRWGVEGEQQHTMAFTALALAQMANCFAVRSERDLIIRVGVFRNMNLVGAVLLTVLSQFAVVYVPALQEVFETVPLSARNLGLCFGAAAAVFVLIELEKLVLRAARGRKGE